MDRPLGLPEIASAHGAELDQATLLVHGLMFVMFVGWSLLFLFMLWKFRASRHPTADYVGLKSKSSTYAEWAVIASEAILLVGFSIPLWSQRVDDFPSPSESTEVRVVGEQFAWNVHYPGPDGLFGRTDVGMVDAIANPLGLDRDDPNAADDVTTINQLHLPVDKPAIVHVSSKDVIHSFMLNEFRVKQDAMPGMRTPLWFIPTVTTAEMRTHRGQDDVNYEIACAQLCGIGHYRMRGFVTIHSQSDYDAWMASELALLAEDEGGDDFWD
jgi:cytochrome c oxidase subunit 2